MPSALDEFSLVILGRCPRLKVSSVSDAKHVLARRATAILLKHRPLAEDRYFTGFIPSWSNRKLFMSAVCLIRSLNAVPIPWPELVEVRNKIG